MEVSYEEAEMFVLDLAKRYTGATKRGITAETAGREYLRHRNDDFSLWVQAREGSDEAL